MNINLTVSPVLVERIALALESIAQHLKLWGPPPTPPQQGAPFGPEYFSTIDNQTSYDQEVEEWLQKSGYGKDYRSYIEAEVKRQVAEIEPLFPSGPSPANPPHP